MKRILISLTVILLIAVSIDTYARTVVEQSSRYISRCENTTDGKEKIRLIRRYSDGTAEMKEMWRNCYAEGPEVWEESGWNPWYSYQPDPSDMPVQAQPDGAWLIMNVPLSSAGTFTDGSGPNHRGFVHDFLLTTIYIPMSIVGPPNLN